MLARLRSRVRLEERGAALRDVMAKMLAWLARQLTHLIRGGRGTRNSCLALARSLHSGMDGVGPRHKELAQVRVNDSLVPASGIHQATI